MTVDAAFTSTLASMPYEGQGDMAVEPAPAVHQPAFSEDIRLVIWDLDETFWRGTLTEGGYTYVDDHHNLVIELARRGIVSSICSKNDLESIRAILQERGLWDYFVFPSIDWTPKASRVKRLIEAVGLRAPTVLLIDDNLQNLHQTQALVADLNIATPDIIPSILAHPRFRGKADDGFSRLKQYRLLEQKSNEQSAGGGDNTDFLRGSDIRVYFEYDVEKHLDRVVELINRTNQLNFTKERMPEDDAAARDELLRYLRHWTVNSALVRVTDKYGDYGFVGFYAMQEHCQEYYLKYFCFSCRTINMYVEHFVYNTIGRPRLEIVGEVVSDVKSTEVQPDWIQLLPIGELQDGGSTVEMVPIDKIYIRGGCDLMPLIHYFSPHTEEIIGEFNWIKNWQVRRWDHSAFLAYSLFGMDEEQLSAAGELGYEHDDFITAMPLGEDAAPVYLLSFWIDGDVPVYRHKETGVELPYYLDGCQGKDLISDTEFTEGLDISQFQIDRLARLRANWENAGLLTETQMIERYRAILSAIPSSSRVFMTLANDRPREYFLDPARPIHQGHRTYNDALRQAVAGFDNVTLIDMGSFVQNLEDVWDVSHLRRELYFKLYEQILAELA